jgi:hypothetical protein
MMTQKDVDCLLSNVAAKEDFENTIIVAAANKAKTRKKKAWRRRFM